MLPKRLKRTTIYESDWINLYTDKVQYANGDIIEKYHYLLYPNESVCVVIENEEREILLIKSNRYVTGREEWEIPAGRIEEGENSEQAAIRESVEETGYQIKECKKMCSFNPSNGMSDLVVQAYWAKIEKKVSEFDINEVKDIFWISKEKALEMLYENKIQCGVSMLALLYVLQFKY